MLTDNDLAAALYDNTPSMKPADPASDMLTGAKATTDVPPASDPDAAIAEKLFTPQEKPAPAFNDTTPAHIRELRQGDAERRMFSPQMQLADAIPADLLAEVAAEGITDEHKAAAVAEWREVATDLNLAGQDVKEFVGLYKQAIANPPTPEQDAQWRNESKKLLVEKYGQRADAVLGLADKLVKRDPRVKQIITHGKLGNHPKVVLGLVEAALRESTRGRLK